MQQHGSLILDDVILGWDVQEDRWCWVNNPRGVREDRMMWLRYSCPECMYFSTEPDWLWHLQLCMGASSAVRLPRTTRMTRENVRAANKRTRT